MTIDGKPFRGLFEHERLKSAIIKTDKGNVSTLSALKRVMNLEISLPKELNPELILPTLKSWNYTDNPLVTLSKAYKGFMV